MNVSLVSITPRAQKLIEYAGRVSHRSEGCDTENFVERLIAMGHESVLEIGVAVIEIDGISRACSHQIVRHRVASYVQESQRYVDMSDPQYVIPPDIKADPEALALWNEYMDSVRKTYRRLRALNIKKEDARFVLPNATTTRLIMSANFREWRHVIRLRTSPRAQWEIRQVANEILDILAYHAPAVFADLKE